MTEATYDEISRDLHAQADRQLRGHEERWRFERGHGVIAEVLLASDGRIRDARPDGTAAIVVESSSEAMHRLIGSVAVTLARRSPVPILIVP